MIRFSRAHAREISSSIAELAAHAGAGEEPAQPAAEPVASLLRGVSGQE